MIGCPKLLHWWQQWDPSELTKIYTTQAKMANRTRARSADRVDPQELLFGQLINELRDLRMDRRADRRENFKPPRFNGEGDVELFIQHFTEVAVANGWNDMATLLYLREALCNGA